MPDSTNQGQQGIQVMPGNHRSNVEMKMGTFHDGFTATCQILFSPAASWFFSAFRNSMSEPFLMQITVLPDSFLPKSIPQSVAIGYTRF